MRVIWHIVVFISALSAVLLFGGCLRGHIVEDRLTITVPGELVDHEWTVNVIVGGGIYVSYRRVGPLEKNPTSTDTAQFEWVAHGKPSRGWNWLEIPQYSSGRGWWRLRVGYGWLVLVAMVIPVVQLAMVRHRRSEQRRKSGRCRSCGYDLRATPRHCPECGWRAPAPLFMPDDHALEQLGGGAGGGSSGGNDSASSGTS